MAEVFDFLKQFELVIYLILGIAGLLYLWRFFGAWQDLRGAVYGLERENAQRRLSQTTAIMLLLLTLSVAEFLVVSFIVPFGWQNLPTPTLSLLTTPGLNGTGQPGDPLVTPLPTLDVSQEGCIPGQVMILSPRQNQEVSGEVNIVGTADIPNFGFYKIEYAFHESLWLTIQAGREPVVGEGELVESWQTSGIPPGEYILQLVVTDTEGNPWPPCRIRITISAEP